MGVPAIAVILIGVTALLLYLNGSALGGIMSSVTGNLTYAQLLALAQGAGFAGQDAVTAAAIALAESGGNPNAYNPETAAGAAAGQGSYGLWQIYRTAHPEFAVENLNDPKTNASAAFTVYMEAGSSFSPWSTYQSQAYQQFVPTSA